MHDFIPKKRKREAVCLLKIEGKSKNFKGIKIDCVTFSDVCWRGYAFISRECLTRGNIINNQQKTIGKSVTIKRTTISSLKQFKKGLETIKLRFS